MVTVRTAYRSAINVVAIDINEDVAWTIVNPALTNALSLILSIGSGISFEEAVKINANFIHDLSALRAIRAAYKARGVASPGGIDEMIYNADALIDKLKELSYQGLIQEGSINTFAFKLSSLAAREGLTTEIGRASCRERV